MNDCWANSMACEHHNCWEPTRLQRAVLALCVTSAVGAAMAQQIPSPEPMSASASRSALVIALAKEATSQQSAQAQAASTPDAATPETPTPEAAAPKAERKLAQPPKLPLPEPPPESLVVKQHVTAVPEPLIARSTDQKPQDEQPLAPLMQKADTLVSEAPAVDRQAAPNNIGPNEVQLLDEPLFASAPTPPRYPLQARRRGQSGTVWLAVTIDPKGRTHQLALLASSGVHALDQAALRAVEQWQFLPYRVNGRALASRVHIPVEFSLN